MGAPTRGRRRTARTLLARGAPGANFHGDPSFRSDALFAAPGCPRRQSVAGHAGARRVHFRERSAGGPSTLLALVEKTGGNYFFLQSLDDQVRSKRFYIVDDTFTKNRDVMTAIIDAARRRAGIS